MVLPFKNMDYGDDQGGATNITELTDVELTNLANGEILKYNTSNSKWENKVGGGLEGQNLYNNFVLKYDTGVNQVVNTSILEEYTATLSKISFYPTDGFISVFVGKIEAQYQGGQNKLRISTDATDPDKGITIDNTGRVGIETNNPTRKLEVNGDIEGDNLFAQTFGPTYSVLPSLIGKIGQIVDAPYTGATLEYNNLIQVRSLTIPYTGVWAIDMSLFLGNATLLTGDIRYSTQIHVNGVNTQRFHGTNVTGVDGSCKRNLNANDVVSFHTRLTGDDAASMTATERLVFGPVWTFLSATRIA